MKKIILAICACFAFAAPAAAAEKRYLVTDFDRVQVEGPFEVALSVGGSSSAVATGSPEALDRISIDVQGRTLRVRPNRSAWGGNPDRPPGPVRIVLATRDLKAGIVTGPGSLAIDRAKGLRLELKVTGSGRLGVGAVDADLVVVGLIGSGKISLAGKAKQLRASIQGTGDLDARSFRTEDADLLTDSAGAIAFSATRSAKIRAGGVGAVEIGGSAACTVTGLGAPGVRCGR